MTKLDNREVAAANELHCLDLLHHFGWARSVDLAALWDGPASGARRMAQRTLKRLLEQRQVLKGQLPNGVPVYALSHRGADRLRGVDANAYESARAGSDLLRNLHAGGEWQHRCLGNELVIWGVHNAAEADYPITWWPERDVLARRTPGTLGEGRIVDRRPDGLALVDGEELMWLEVERTGKPARSHRRLMEALRLTADGLREDGVVLTVAALAATERRYLKKVRDQLAREAEHDARSARANVSYLLYSGYANFEPWPDSDPYPWERTDYGRELEPSEATEADDDLDSSAFPTQEAVEGPADAPVAQSPERMRKARKKKPLDLGRLFR